MNMNDLSSRIWMCLVAACAILGLATALFPPPPVTISVGRLAEKSTNLVDQRVRVINGVEGVTSGRYVIFKSKVESRHHVVIDLDCDMPGETDYVGICKGVRSTPLPGCSCPAPFMLVVAPGWRE